MQGSNLGRRYQISDGFHTVLASWTSLAFFRISLGLFLIFFLYSVSIARVLCEPFTQTYLKSQKFPCLGPSPMMPLPGVLMQYLQLRFPPICLRLGLFIISRSGLAAS